VDTSAARRLLLAGTGVLFLLRFGLSLLRTGPLVFPDEFGYLSNARLLAGGLPGTRLVAGTSDVEIAAFFRGGYSLVIAPLVGLSDPEIGYRLVLALNAALAAALAPLVYALLTRCFGTAPRVAVWPALAAAAYPSVTAYSQIALAENLLLPMMVIWLICFGRLLDVDSQVGRAAWGVAFAVCAVGLFAVHGRMVVAVALGTAALILLAFRPPLMLRAELLGVGVILAGITAVHLFNRFLISENYGGFSGNETGSRLENLRDIEGLLAVARNLVGHSWYVMVATLGIAVIFAFAAAPRALARICRRNADTPELVIGLLLAAGGALLVVSALSFRDIENAERLVHGRYVEVVIPPLLAVALVRLSSIRWDRWLPAAVGVLAAATGAVVALRAAINPSDDPSRWHIPSIPFVTFNLGPAELAGAGIIAAASLVGLAAVGRRAPTLLAPAVLLLFLPTTAVAERNPVLSEQQARYPAGWTSPGAAAPQARVVAFDTDYHFGVYIYQWFMPNARFVLFSGSASATPARFVISSRAWAPERPHLHTQPLWSDPGSDHVLYRIGGGS
jgi:hypothetical protein